MYDEQLSSDFRDLSVFRDLRSTLMISWRSADQRSIDPAGGDCKVRNLVLTSLGDDRSIPGRRLAWDIEHRVDSAQ